MVEDNAQQVMFVLDGEPESALVVPLEENSYFLASTPLGLFSDIDLYWGDVIEADFHEDGLLYFIRLVERGPFEHKEYVLSQKVAESAEFAQLVREIVSCGGLTEIIMRGIFWCHLPTKCKMDVDAHLKDIYKNIQVEKHS